MCYGGVGGSPQLEPLPPELPPRAPLDESDSRLLGGGGAGLSTPFAETPEATGAALCKTHTCIGRDHVDICYPNPVYILRHFLNM